MRDRRIIEPEPFLWLLEISTDQVLEIVDVHADLRVESTQIIYRDKSARHVPFVPARLLVSLANIVWRLIIFSEITEISVGIRVPHGLVREIAQRLVVANRPTDFRIHVRFYQLGSPISMISGDKTRHCNVV